MVDGSSCYIDSVRGGRRFLMLYNNFLWDVNIKLVLNTVTRQTVLCWWVVGVPSSTRYEIAGWRTIIWLWNKIWVISPLCVSLPTYDIIYISYSIYTLLADVSYHNIWCMNQYPTVVLGTYMEEGDIHFLGKRVMLTCLHWAATSTCKNSNSKYLLLMWESTQRTHYIENSHLHNYYEDHELLIS